MKKNKPCISIKVVTKDGKVKSISSRKRGRINRFIEANNFKDCVAKVSVKYGPGMFNQGTYKTKDNLVYALKTFLDPGL